MLLGRLVERAPDDPEVLLRREGAAVSLGRRPVGDVVEQRLGRGADDGDDVRSRGRGRLGGPSWSTTTSGSTGTGPS